MTTKKTSAEAAVRLLYGVLGIGAMLLADDVGEALEPQFGREAAEDLRSRVEAWLGKVLAVEYARDLRSPGKGRGRAARSYLKAFDLASKYRRAVRRRRI